MTNISEAYKQLGQTRPSLVAIVEISFTHKYTDLHVLYSYVYVCLITTETEMLPDLSTYPKRYKQLCY